MSARSSCRTFYPLFIAFYLLLSLPGHAAAYDRILNMLPGAVETVQIGAIKRVAVGLETVAAANVLDTGALLIIARAAGETDIRVWTEGDRSYRIKVKVALQSSRSSADTMRAVFKGIDGLSVREANELILLEGALSPEQRARVAAILASMEKATALPANVVSLISSESAVLTPMVRMDVRIVEVNKRALQKLGIRWQNLLQGPSLGTHVASTVNNAFGITGDATSAGMVKNIPVNDHAFYGYAGITSYATSVIDLLAENNEAKVLAAPVLITQSGTPAHFLSGGEIPIPFRDETGRLQVQFKEYGVRLDIQPHADPDGTISSKVNTEVSTVDEGIRIDGVPGFLSRKTESIVAMRDGETMVISGIVSINELRGTTKVPLLGDIPILGALFRSKDFNEQQSELVIFVTPRLTSPASPLNTQLLAPAQASVQQTRQALHIDNAILE